MPTLLERADDLQAAILTVRRLVAADPTQDDANATLMWLYASAGCRIDALRHYGYFRQLLDRELGAEPGLATKRLSEEIRNAAPLAPCSRLADGRAPATARLCHVPRRTLSRRIAPNFSARTSILESRAGRSDRPCSHRMRGQPPVSRRQVWRWSP